MTNERRPLILWLGLCCAMIFLMALIGAVTRLTESGLSITRWEPVKGALPPMSDTAWQEQFDLYKATPQYKAINQGMSLPEFKNIYFWEWVHRLWGRLIGLVYAAGLVYFWIRKQIPPGYKAPLVIALALGGLQGFVGWYMVQSGLQPGMAAVSHYRLALHLGLALILYAWLLIQMLKLSGFPSIKASYGLRVHASMGLVFLAAAMVWGAFTAGLDAGKIYNTFPMMNGDFLPRDAVSMEPRWKNILENPAGVQFVHRVLTITTAIILLLLSFRLYKIDDRTAKRVAIGLGAMCVIQPGLGIATLLTNVNIPLAALHQAGAIALLSAVLAALMLLSKKTD
jgi:cytochrome c oxidase assembly protein subunit 15